jgi:uncharacterized protein
MANLDAALVVFLRRPSHGVGKQRLVPTLGASGTLAIAQALLACTLEDASLWEHALVLAPAEPGDAAWAAGLLGPRARIEPQPPGNLGERLQGVDARLRAGGLERLLFIGSDAPSMTLAGLEQAAAALRDADVVLIPALDGGVALMGARRPWPALAALPWSTPGLGAALEGTCIAGGLTVSRLPASYDVDEPADLERAARELARDARPARRRLAALLAELHASA